MVGSDRVRLVFAVVSVVFAATLLVSYAAPQVTGDELRDESSLERAFETGDRDPIVEPRENITVIATDSTAFVTDEGSGPRERAELVALAPDGSIYYHNNSHTRYWDVDPVPGTDATVEYVYADHLDADECDAETVCTRNGVERVNLTTGDVTDVYSRITPGKHSTRWHDVDRIDEHRLLVADIDRDRAYVVNTTSQFVEWEWDAQSEFDTEGGGPYPEDWTHMNDVELVDIDGRDVVMISLRNQDQVVFVDMERGLMDEWTLGSEDDYDTIYEQHNPDFIPAERGGPAVVVADSENGRVLEYQREDGDWEQSWTWEDRRLQWPRDADRLPNGNTLVTDSNGNRVIEVAPNGSVVWSVDIGFPYEAERLGTGDESAGGESAARLDLTSREPSADSGTEQASQSVLDLLPKPVVNGIIYLLPSWVGPLQILAVLGLLVAVPLWARHEWRRADLQVDVQSPLDVRRR
jgi:hypothetical protein